MTGVGAASSFRRCIFSVLLEGAARRQISLPVERSRAMVRSFPSWCAVRKILVSVTIGEDLPGGRLVSQITLEPGPKTAGSGPSSATPVPFGPRNRVQSDAIATQVKTSRDRSVLANGMAKDYPISTDNGPAGGAISNRPFPACPTLLRSSAAGNRRSGSAVGNRCSNPWRTPTGRQRIDSVIAVYGRTCIPADFIAPRSHTG